MPLYEYQCKSCSKQFEHLVREDSRPVCPACQSGDLERVLSVFAVGASTGHTSPASAPSPCDSCGHPGGPGACAWSN